jgi:hypothetical protein
MQQAVIQQAAPVDIVEPQMAGVSWAAVLAGATASCALTLVMISFGAGLGFSVVSPWGGSGVSATTFKIGTGLYFVVMALVSSAIGGYLAGRLRSRWIGVESTEIHFRDTAHGFLAWAVASVVGAMLLASPASSLLGGAASGAAQGAASAVQSTGPIDGYIDSLLRPANPAAPAQPNATDARPELLRLFGASFRGGTELNPTDQSYAAKVVAARTGLSEPDAQKRVADVVNQAKTDLDAARKAAMQIAMWLTLSLFIGAFAAALAATEGGGRRDGTWGKKISGTIRTNTATAH